MTVAGMACEDMTRDGFSCEGCTAAQVLRVFFACSGLCGYPRVLHGESAVASLDYSINAWLSVVCLQGRSDHMYSFWQYEKQLC